MGWGTVAIAVVLGVVIWLVDFAAAALGAKAFGASRRSIVGASVGLVVGLFLGPMGIVLGPIVGAVAVRATRGTRTSGAPPGAPARARSSGSCSGAR